MVSFKRFQKGLTIALIVSLALLLLAGGVYAQTDSRTVEVAVLPATLERISWGGIIAGTILAIVIQLAGNLLSIGVGVSRINPNPEYGEETASAQSIGTGTIVMMAITVIISLFIGGFVAARFAGSPDRSDAVLNGLMVWGLDTVITLFLLMTTLGTVFSGFSALLRQGLRLIGSASSAVAHGASNVVQGVANVAGNAASAAGSAAQNVAGASQDAIQN
jgi:hypothetical protein